jgi:hypothetical protein
VRRPGARIAVALVTVAVVVALFVVLAGGDDDSGDGGSTTQANTPTTTTQTTTTQTTTVPPPERIVVRNGEPVGGVQRLEFDSGDRVRFAVQSDVADEVHVHGYDISEDVAAGGSVRFSFPGDIEGVFEVELEGRGEQIAELRVSP